jgi:hypothetical protein
MKKRNNILVSISKGIIVLLFIGLVNMSYSQSLPSSINDYNLKNAEGYVSVEKNGVVKHFIVVSNRNGIGLIPVKENPAKILKSVKNIISNINNQRGNTNEK